MRRTMRRGGVVAGCLIALGVVVVLLVIGGIVVAMNWRSWTAQGLHAIVESAIDDSTLPVEEKQEIMAVVDRFTTEFEAGDVSAEQFGRVFEELSTSPIIPAMIVLGVEDTYLKSSSLTDEEKAQGSKELSRFVHGVSEEMISQTKIDDVTEPLHAEPGSQSRMSIHAGNLNIELKQPEDVTPDELRQFLANAKQVADDAGVPDQRYEIDWSAELGAAIDRAMGRAAVEPDDGETVEPPVDEGG